MSDNKTKVETLLEQAAAYRVGAALFAGGPTKDLLKEFRTQKEHLEGPLAQIASLIPEDNLEEMRTDLNAEYARLFYNMSAYPVFLFESVYNSEEEVMMREQYDQMKALFNEEGVQVEGMEKVAEDHVAHELLFMAILKERTAEALEAEDSEKYEEYEAKQKTFFEEHLNTWVHIPMESTQKLTKEPYFEFAAEFVKNLLKEDSALLD